MRFSRQSIAAAATIVALGTLAAVALASGGTEPTTTVPAPTSETDPAPQVRTEVVRRTVHRNASSDDDGTADQGPGDAPRTPVAPSATASGHDVGDDHGRHGRDDDHGDDDDHDNSGPGSSSSGHGSGGDDDSSGHGGGDDDSSGHGGDDD